MTPAAIAIKDLRQMEWKLVIFAFGLHLVITIGGFVLIPKEPPVFGMGMIPGPLALFSGIGIPAVAAFSIGIGVFRKSKMRKGLNTAFFFFGSMIIWIVAFILFY